MDSEHRKATLNPKKKWLFVGLSILAMFIGSKFVFGTDGPIEFLGYWVFCAGVAVLGYSGNYAKDDYAWKAFDKIFFVATGLALLAAIYLLATNV